MHINKDEVLRYLGYRRQVITDSLNALIEDLINETKNIIRPKATYQQFAVEVGKTNLVLAGTNVELIGKDIARHLKDSTQCIVLATTLGWEIEQKINYYKRFDLTKSVVLDVCASVAIESYTDEIELEIRALALEQNYGITYRYSPGYGDFPITSQRMIVRSLEADKRIGLTVTEDSILLPRKSITAIIGLQDRAIISVHPGCNDCSSRDFCRFAKEGGYCGK